ncbi:MAG: homocysteine S-methyltransferase family protein [Candidatus Thiodiazotropha sp. (ex Codakia rugifera)]|nr:homocysteine S-methyltransferase family protein [Candidatus Thiodiazotropha sp. (ex Codakia rugifera)]
MKRLLESNRLILLEAAIVEQLRRSSDIHLHKRLVNAPLIYEKAGFQALVKLYQDYIDCAVEAAVPFLMCTPTWRANRARVSESGINPSINRDAAQFMRRLRNTPRNRHATIKIGGMIGCKNDCYQPSEGLATEESEHFHAWQIEQLVQGDVDFLIAVTLPNVEEAIGIAKAMAQTDIPYIISFVINRSGDVLDGTHLNDAIGRIDSVTRQNPVGYMVNCSYPTFLSPEQQSDSLFSRLIGFQANASSLDHCNLDDADQLQAEHISVWGQAMLTLNRDYGIKILGGCCGTRVEHLRYIADMIHPSSSSGTI